MSALNATVCPVAALVPTTRIRPTPPNGTLTDQNCASPYTVAPVCAFTKFSSSVTEVLELSDTMRPHSLFAAVVLLAAEQLYTCGMHPQIIKKEPGNCPICGMKLTPIRANKGLIFSPAFLPAALLK